jgi:hypothetical protein
MKMKTEIRDAGLVLEEAKTGWLIVRSEQEFISFIECRLRDEGLELVETSPKTGKNGLRNVEA